MATQAATKSIKVNFLEMGDKETDFRFKFHWSHFMKNAEKTIYWIGSINLLELSKNAEVTKLQFLTSGAGSLRSVVDTYADRYEDGKEIGSNSFFHYSLSDVDLKQEILKAKAAGDLWFHILLEETVDGYGVHTVDLLYSDNGEDTVRGIASRYAMWEIPFNQIYSLADAEVNEKTKRIQLLGHDCYHWMK
jgi:hypothetical protein